MKTQMFYLPRKTVKCYFMPVMATYRSMIHFLVFVADDVTRAPEPLLLCSWCCVSVLDVDESLVFTR